MGNQPHFVEAANKYLFRQKLKRIRLEMKLTQKALGENSGLSSSYISDLECGRRGIRFYNICRLAKSLGVTVSELLDFSDLEPTDEAL